MLVYQKSSGTTKKASAFRIFALQLAPASEYNWPYVPICLGVVPRCIPWWCSKNDICILMTCCHPKGSQAKYCPWQWQAMVDIIFQGLSITKCLYFEESPLRGTHPFLRGNQNCIRRPKMVKTLPQSLLKFPKAMVIFAFELELAQPLKRFLQNKQSMLSWELSLSRIQRWSALALWRNPDCHCHGMHHQAVGGVGWANGGTQCCDVRWSDSPFFRWQLAG